MDRYSCLACESGMTALYDGIYGKRSASGITRLCNRVENEEQSQRLGREVGSYVTLLQENATSTQIKRSLSVAISTELKTLAEPVRRGKRLKIFVAGLGNPHLAADCLGSRVCDKLVLFGNGDIVTAKAIGVFASSGIESSDVVKSLAELLSADLVIAVDTLATSTPSRIGRAIQLTDTGLVPGKGVGHSRNGVDEQTVGCRVIAIGAALVASIDNLVKEDSGIGEMHLVPKEIDILTEYLSDVIAAAINMAFVGLPYRKALKNL